MLSSRVSQQTDREEGRVFLAPQCFVLEMPEILREGRQAAGMW